MMVRKMRAISKQGIRIHAAKLFLRYMVIAFMFSTNILFAQVSGAHNCSEFSSFFALSAKDTESRVINRKDMSGGILATIAAKADIYVRVYADDRGLVVCAKVTGKGNSLKSLAEETAMKWTFTPFLRRGRPVPFQGIIVFHVDL